MYICECLVIMSAPNSSLKGANTDKDPITTSSSPSKPKPRQRLSSVISLHKSNDNLASSVVSGASEGGDLEWLRELEREKIALEAQAREARLLCLTRPLDDMDASLRECLREADSLAKENAKGFSTSSSNIQAGLKSGHVEHEEDLKHPDIPDHLLHSSEGQNQPRNNGGRLSTRARTMSLYEIHSSMEGDFF